MAEKWNRKRVYTMLFIGVLLYFLANLQRVAIPGSIFNELQNDLQVSAKYITAFGAVFMYIYAAGQLVVGVLTDRYGGERVILFGAMLFAAGSLLFPFCSSLQMLYLSRFLVGAGASAFYLSIVKILATRFPKKFPVFLGLILLGGYTGSIVATAPLVYMVERFSWRSCLGVVGVATIIITLLFYFSRFGVRIPRVNTRIPFSFRIYLDLLKRRHNRNMILYSSCSFGSYYCLQTIIGKKFLEDFCQMPGSRAAMVLSVMAIISSVSGFCMALVSQKFGSRRKIFLVLSGAVAVFTHAFILLALSCNWRTSIIAVLLCIVTWGANQGTLTVPIMKDTNLPENMGGIVSLCNGIVYIAVALFGNLTGILLDLYAPEKINGVMIYSNSSYIAVFSLFFFISCLTLYNACRLRDTRGENVASTTP